MADPVLHIKDSYYFEVPKVLCPSNFKGRGDFPEVWVRLDPDFQEWEFGRAVVGQYDALETLNAELPPKEEAHAAWQQWVHADHANFAKPFDEFLESKYQAHLAAFKNWKDAQIQEATAAGDSAKIRAARELTLAKYLETDNVVEQPYVRFSELRSTADFQAKWASAKQRAGKVAEYRTDPHVAEWNQAKVDAYNGHLSGKILIPQPFGELRNMYEPASGFCISKYMVLEVAIGLILCLAFSRVAAKISKGGAPRGYFWNLMEVFLVFIRDQIVVPSIGGGHGEEHSDEHHGHADANHVHGDDSHGHHGAKHRQVDDATRLLPLFWTIFFFVLGCNLFGMIPWLGAPSSSFSVTTGLALVTLVVGVVCGIQKFGLLGYLGNQIPSMDLPWYMAIVIKPLVYAIEVMGLMIKHAVLAIRLLANMVAGHLVILGIMGVAFGATAAVAFSDPHTPSWQWPVAATIAVVAATLFNLLELFVAFLQAYVFTFLSALFIGAAMHKH